MDLQRWGNVASAAALILILLLIGGYGLDLAWIGFSDYTYTLPENQEFQRGKTVWDWLQLLLVPLALALIAYLFNSAEKANDRRIAQDNQHEATLQSYLDQMTELLLEKNLRQLEDDSVGNPEVRTIARVRTLTTLRRLDGPRCITVFRFLHDAHLTHTEEDDPLNIINLREADLSHKDLQGASIDRVCLVKANLRKTNLSGATLEFVNFNKACLIDADLRDTALRTVQLHETDLRGADLRDTRLVKTHLDDAKLQDAKFDGASLTVVHFETADLTGATFTDAELRDVFLDKTNVTLEQLKPCKVVKNVTLRWEKIKGDEDYPSHWK